MTAHGIACRLLRAAPAGRADSNVPVADLASEIRFLYVTYRGHPRN